MIHTLGSPRLFCNFWHTLTSPRPSCLLTKTFIPSPHLEVKLYQERNQSRVNAPSRRLSKHCGIRNDRIDAMDQQITKLISNSTKMAETDRILLFPTKWHAWMTKLGISDQTVSFWQISKFAGPLHRFYNFFNSTQNLNLGEVRVWKHESKSLFRWDEGMKICIKKSRWGEVVIGLVEVRWLWGYDL